MTDEVRVSLDLITDQLNIHLDNKIVNVGFNEAGMVVLKRILTARTHTPTAGRKIGTPSKPTDSMVREYLKTHKVKKLPTDRKAAKSQMLDDFFASLDPDDFEINL